MPSKRRPQARRSRSPRAEKPKSISINIVSGSRRANKPRAHAIPLSRLPKRSSEARTKALHVLAAMRRDDRLSLSKAARLEGVKVSTVKHYFSSRLTKVNGHWRVSKSDRFRETMYVPDERGNPVPVHTKTSRERAQVSAFLRDLGRYYRGDTSALAAWHGKSIVGVSLVTAPRTLKSIEAQLSDFAIYSTFNGGAE